MHGEVCSNRIRGGSVQEGASRDRLTELQPNFGSRGKRMASRSSFAERLNRFRRLSCEIVSCEIVSREIVSREIDRTYRSTRNKGFSRSVLSRVGRGRLDHAMIDSR